MRKVRKHFKQNATSLSNPIGRHQLPANKTVPKKQDYLEMVALPDWLVGFRQPMRRAEKGWGDDGLRVELHVGHAIMPSFMTPRGLELLELPLHGLEVLVGASEALPLTLEGLGVQIGGFSLSALWLVLDREG